MREGEKAKTGPMGQPFSGARGAKQNRSRSDASSVSYMCACHRALADLQGLGLLGGRCTRLAVASGAGRLKVPHVGWNDLRVVSPARLLAGIDDGAYVYFTHSYVAPVTDSAVATTAYGEVFASVVERGLVAGVQFHPEKSGDVGLKILENFAGM